MTLNLTHTLPLLNSTKARKAYIVLTCGPPSLSGSLPKGKGEDGESCSESDDEGSQMVSWSIFTHFLCRDLYVCEENGGRGGDHDRKER